ncbi:MAG: hypothetical protein IPG45_00645 [Deltaproteobacteria bacterium]|nr:hypothetical protein [Deltaproteobacteria bacterium]
MARPFLRVAIAQIVGAAPLLLSTSPAVGQDAGESTTATLTLADVSTARSDPKTPQVRALIAGTLAPEIDPQSLFDVALDDEAALQVEAARVRAILRAADEAVRPPEAPPKTRTRGRPASAPDAGGLRAELAALNPGLWFQRLELDQARLQFYQLSAEQRADLLQAHAARRQVAQPTETAEERRALEIEAERERALQAAKEARSETERLVTAEIASLIALEMQVRALRDEFQRAREETALRRDVVLGWQRRVREGEATGPPEADATYDALRRALRASRDDLSAALDALVDGASRVPALGPDPLADLPPDFPTEAARERRTVVERAILEARADERALQVERAASLLDEINVLNRERLNLLLSLSPDKREATTGFTPAGWDQARAEARHLSLILWYHQQVATAWVNKLISGKRGGVSLWRITVVLLPLLLLFGAFFWGKRRTQALLIWGEARLAAADRAEQRSRPSVGLRALRILLKTHRPLEWIFLFFCVSWLLPKDARDLLELQLLFSVARWTLAGSLVINFVNALASGDGGAVLSLEDGQSGKLRLRSLRLVGRTVITLALALVLGARLVGEGTIYSWVIFVCWFAAIPVFLLLVRWWRGDVFDRLDRLRKKTPLQAWILANRSGWKSFAAAMIGAVLLFTTGALKFGRARLSGFELARRIHAYLFKREIERIGEGHPHEELAPLNGEAFEKFHPERPFDRWLSCPADELLEGLTDRASTRRGALIVVVAPRGMGKSSLLRAVALRSSEAKIVECHDQTGASDLQAVAEASPSIILIDNAHSMIQARVGGLAKFDQAMAFARAHSNRTTWVFAMDASVWPLLKRARDARPMFDETHLLSPWREGQLGALIAARCQVAGIVPRYDSLLDKLPAGVSEDERQEAVEVKRVGYERMLWDHTGGNPGLALEAWRASLGEDAGSVVHVRPLQVPDASKIEHLPDSSLFVLRAVLQLAPTTVETVAEATRLRADEVVQDLRFGEAQGFYESRSGRVRIAWAWLRAVTRLLERRHLLGTP